jgi:hypothetical protein
MNRRPACSLSSSRAPGPIRRGAVLFLLLLVGSSALRALPERVVADETLEAVLAWRSEWWPYKVELREPFSPGEGKRTIPAGTDAVLVRVEGREALLDFGRNGIHRLGFEQTDLLLRALARSREPVDFKGLGVFTGVMFNKFFRVENGRARSNREWDFAGKRYLVLLYVEVGSEDGERFVTVVNRHREAADESLDDVEHVLIPYDRGEDELLEAVRARAFEGPVMYHFIAPGYTRSFQHGAGEEPTAVVIDHNGRILWGPRPVASEATLEQLFTELPTVLAHDRARR